MNNIHSRVRLGELSGLTMGRGNWTLSLALISGVLLAHQFSSLPPDWLVFSVILPALFLLFWRPGRWIGVFLLAACWTLWNFALQLDDRLEASLAGKTVVVDGMVAGLPDEYPDYIRFRFEPVQSATDPSLPGSLLVYWYRDRPQVLAGQRWRLELRLSPPWGRVNFQGSDRERWLFSQKIGALGTVRSGDLLQPASWAAYPLQMTRSLVREKIRALVIDDRARGVVQALSIADRNGLSFSDRQLMVATGTSHLLAISGLHIGLAAVGGTWLARLAFALLRFPPYLVPGFRAALASGLLVALAYAALAGWGVSTQRAVIMIAVAVTTLLFSRAVNPLRAYILALSAVLVIDPLAPLGAGFWFSFLAVAVLMLLFIPRTGRLAWWKTILLAQAGVMFAMLPASIHWFQLFSPVGFLANMVAIPWVSLTIVPLTLTGVTLMLVSDGLATLVLGMAAQASLTLLAFLEFAAQLQGSLPLFPAPGVVPLLIASLGGILMLMPAALHLRWLGPFLMLPLFFPPGLRTESGSLLIEALDVGQGTSVLLSTPEHTLLYDSGPGDGDGHDLVNSVITPALISLGRGAPERIVISHGDLDHAGGIKSLERRYPDAQWNVNLSVQPQAYGRCLAGLHWNWDEFDFEVLHPSSGLPYLGNDSSCVLSVRGKPGSVLLTGDISMAVEKRLSSTSLDPYRVLLVPHHGSSGSSGSEFIAGVQAQIAIATTGLGNRFGFPREDVKQRYSAAGVKFWSSGDCGALRILMTGDGMIHASSARRQRNRIWRWPAADECP